MTDRERIKQRLAELERIEDRKGNTITEAELLRLNLALRDLGAALAKPFEPLLRRLRRKP